MLQCILLIKCIGKCVLGKAARMAALLAHRPMHAHVHHAVPLFIVESGCSA